MENKKIATLQEVMEKVNRIWFESMENDEVYYRLGKAEYEFKNEIGEKYTEEYIMAKLEETKSKARTETIREILDIITDARFEELKINLDIK